MLLSTGRDFFFSKGCWLFPFYIEMEGKWAQWKEKDILVTMRMINIRGDKENSEITILEILTEIMNGCFSLRFEILPEK